MKEADRPSLPKAEIKPALPGVGWVIFLYYKQSPANTFHYNDWTSIKVNIAIMKRTTDTTIDHGHLPQLLGYQLRLTQLAVFKDFSDSVSDTDMTPSLFAVLVVINANPGLKQNELAKAVHLDRSTVVSAIDKLERRKLVQRKRVAGDRRTNALQLTDAGSTLLAQLIVEVSEHERRLAAQLTHTERETLIQLLSKVSPISG